MKNEVKEANQGVEEAVLVIVVPTKEAGNRKPKVQTIEMERDRSPDLWQDQRAGQAGRHPQGRPL